MSTEFALLFSLLACILILSLLRVEKLVKLSFGAYLLLFFSLALGLLISNLATVLQATPDLKIFGILYSDFSKFLLNAQPTIILLFYILGLWGFTSNATLSIQTSSDLFMKQMQTILWSVLSIGSLISSIYFSLFYFKGAVYEWLFMQAEILPYSKWIPLLACVIGIFTFFSASQINIRFSFKKKEPESLL